jgi:hypothetical protein
MSHFQLKTSNGVTYLSCLPFESLGVTAATSTRLGGVSPLSENALNLGYFQGVEPKNVKENRRRFLSAVSTDGARLVTMRQTHSNRCVVVGHAPDDEPPTCDALITRGPGVMLGVQTADCAPILIFDSRTRALGAVHAGWRGTLARIAEETLKTMHADYGTRGEDCHAALGPTIGRCCYEVGSDVTEPFKQQFSYADLCISNHAASGKAHLDLIEANVRQLLECSVPRSQIYLGDYCTACNTQLFFSYRREGRLVPHVGRLLSVICDNNPM